MDKSAEPLKEPPKEKPAETGILPGARTRGLWLLDALIYPILNNFVVFTVSVVATYLTKRGGVDRNAAGELKWGKIGQWFQNRGDWLAKKFESFGMSEKSADMSKMVFFSFADGSIMAPFVKLLEDRREQIGRWLDKKMGTEPEDDSVYKAEPKQTWMSVLGGRLLTAAIVVPTAAALDRNGLNDKLFNNPGEKFGTQLAEKQWMQPINKIAYVPEVTRIAFFEAFYTTVCTAGLYISSRVLACFGEGRKENAPHEPPATSPKEPHSPTYLEHKPMASALKAHEGFANRYLQETRPAIGLGTSV